MQFKGKINLDNRPSELDIHSVSDIGAEDATEGQDDFFVFSERGGANIHQYTVSDGVLLSIGDVYFDDEPFRSKIDETDITLDWLVENCEQLYGHFLLLYAGSRSDGVLVISDKASAMSLYYHINDRVLFLSSNVLHLKHLWSDEYRPPIRKTALFEFLATGHLWGRNTYWEGVKRIGPAERLHVTENGHTIKKYWQFSFDNTISSEETAITYLQNAIQKDIELLPEGKPILTLSGGYDSRALLGYLDESPRDFDIISYSWGAEYEDDFDAEVASYYASKIGYDVITHEVDLSEIDRILTDIDRTIEITGGEADTTVTKDAILGPQFFTDLNDDYDYLLRGDEVWGWGDYVFDNNSAFWQALLFNVSQIPNLEDLLTDSTFETATGYVELFRSEVQQDVDTIVSSNKQLQDYIYWNHREARLLQTKANHRRQFIPHYAPFLFGHGFNAVNNMSDKQRVNKKLFLQAMRDKFPVLFQDDNEPTGKRAVRSKFEILYSQQQFQTHITQDLFDDPHPLIAEIFDMGTLKNWGSEVLRRTPGRSGGSKQKYNVLRTIYNLSQKSNYVNAALTSLYINVKKGEFPIMDFELLFRIFVLNKSLKKYA